MTRYPAAASAGIWWFHDSEVSGKPCSSTTPGPSTGPATRASNTSGPRSGSTTVKDVSATASDMPGPADQSDEPAGDADDGVAEADLRLKNERQSCPAIRWISWWVRRSTA